MAIGSHGTGRGGTVGDDRTGRSADLGKALSFLSVFGAAGVETDQERANLKGHGEKVNISFDPLRVRDARAPLHGVNLG